jgi:hypothetical protein
VNQFVNVVKLVVENYVKYHDIDLKLLVTYQKIKHAQIKPIKKNSQDTKGEEPKEKGKTEQKKEENVNELPTIDKTKKKVLKTFLLSNVETAIRYNCRDIVEYFFSVYDFQFLSKYSPLGVLFQFIHSH